MKAFLWSCFSSSFIVLFHVVVVWRFLLSLDLFFLHLFVSFSCVCVACACACMHNYASMFIIIICCMLHDSKMIERKKNMPRVEMIFLHLKTLSTFAFVFTEQHEEIWKGFSGQRGVKLRRRKILVYVVYCTLFAICP